MTERTPGFATLAVHAGAQPDPTTGARATPIYQTTSPVSEDDDPPASLFGLQTFGDISSFERAVTDKTKAIFIESIANPGGFVTDIEAISRIAKKAGVPLIVDNTLATPYLCRPISHGADIVVHSLTKFLGGHGNSIGGLIVDAGTFDWTRSKRYPMLTEPRPEYDGIVLHETFGNFAFAIACRVLALRDLGPALSPFNAFLILTGIETLPLRMRRHCDNTQAVAEWLAAHPKVAWVSYPGLP